LSAKIVSDDEAYHALKKDRVKRSPSPWSQTDPAPSISTTPLIIIAVASSLGLLATLFLCCKTLFCKDWVTECDFNV